MSSLPVAAVLPELLTALDGAPQILLSAPTGAGKSTWLPLQLLAHPGINGKIILLEPRRLAARTVANRIAEELKTEPGGCIGYKVRFSDHVSDNTMVKLMTDGILLAEIQQGRVVWRRVTSRNGWRSCLTKSQAIPLATGCVRKTASGQIPAWKWLPKAC